MADPVLNENDLQSQSWLKLKRFLEERLAKLRAMNDNDLGETRTARLRGQIAEVRHLLSLAESRPMAPPETNFKD
jgi:hypothetical protein